MNEIVEVEAALDRSPIFEAKEEEPIPDWGTEPPVLAEGGAAVTGNESPE